MKGEPPDPVASRPAVSVIVPFRGDEDDAMGAARALRELDSAEGDELIVADNTADGVAGPALAGVARVVRAVGETSSYHARNAGAAVAGCDWLLFVDADCEPDPGLLDRYFGPPPEAEDGLLAGTIGEDPDRDSLLARYASARNFYRGESELDGDGGYAPTGNLMVRRSAFEEVGGFTEGIRSGGDVDLCWRLQGAGWRLRRRPEAIVRHRHRADLPSFLAMLARYGAGSSWLDSRYPGSTGRWPLSPTELARSGLDAIRLTASGRHEEAVFRIVDALGLIAHNIGYLQSNEAR